MAEKTENDYSVFGNTKIPGLPRGDNGDRYRTGAIQMNFGIASLGLNVFTGDPGIGSDKQSPNNTYGTSLNGSDPNKYREGIMYVGVGPIRMGINSEKNIRGPIQNGFHDKIDTPHFRVLDIPDVPYFYFGWGTGDSLW